MAIKLKKTVKKFSSTKPAWDELENCIKDNCSEPIKKLIEAGESQDKIKDTVNYLIDHIMEGDSEKKEFSNDGFEYYVILDPESSNYNRVVTTLDDEKIIKQLRSGDFSAVFRVKSKDDGTKIIHEYLNWYEDDPERVPDIDDLKRWMKQEKISHRDITNKLPKKYYDENNIDKGYYWW